MSPLTSVPELEYEKFGPVRLIENILAGAGRSEVAPGGPHGIARVSVHFRFPLEVAQLPPA